MIEDSLIKSVGANWLVPTRCASRTPSNQAWRRPIAETPAFSEYHLWAETGGPVAANSVTYVVRSDTWESVPACEESVGCRTPLGLRIDEERTAADSTAMATIGPCKARALTPVDYGLMTRANLEGTWYCGVWEATSHVTNHRPADCLNTIVNIGNIPPHARRAIRGNG